MTRQITYPGVYVEELPDGIHTIEAVATSVVAFVGKTLLGPVNLPQTLDSYAQFEDIFGTQDEFCILSHAVNDFFMNGGLRAVVVRTDCEYDETNEPPTNKPPSKLQIYSKAFKALAANETFNMLCLPPDELVSDIDPSVLRIATNLCIDNRALLIVDPRKTWSQPSDIPNRCSEWNAIGLDEANARNTAVFFPSITKSSVTEGEQEFTMVPCGAIAGVMARTDLQRGVWKAAAGLDAKIVGGLGLSLSLTNIDNDILNSRGVNCIRAFPSHGPVIWGARTLDSAHCFSEGLSYVPIRRLQLFIEASIDKGLQWVVFEPNDEALWTKIRSSIDTFMFALFRNGALQGSTPRDAYFVKCDRESTTEADINAGFVNILIGFAPLKPAEFVVIHLKKCSAPVQNSTIKLRDRMATKPRLTTKSLRRIRSFRPKKRSLK